MKMAKASQADLDAALKVAQIIGELEKGFMPMSDDGENNGRFYRNDPDQCLSALNSILDAAEYGSMFRVTFGMLVLLDPRNEVVDPDSDVLEMHPKIKAALENHEQTSTAESIDADRKAFESESARFGYDLLRNYREYGITDFYCDSETEKAWQMWLTRAALSFQPTRHPIAMCKGSMKLGTGCGKCSRCKAELEGS